MNTDGINFPGSGGLSGTSGTTSSSTGPFTPLINSSSADVLESAATDQTTATSSSSSGISLTAPMSIVEFSNVINSATNLSSQVAYQSQQFADVKLKAFYEGNVITALELLELYKQVSNIAPAISTIFTNQKANQNALNTQISTTNAALISNDNDQINIMNQAIKDYQHGAIDSATYFNAVNTYNTYVASRSVAVTSINSQISTYNANVANENATIDTLNAQLASLHFHTLSHQQSYSNTVGSLPTLSTSVATTTLIPSESTLSQATLTISPDLSNKNINEIVAFYIDPIFDLINGSIQDLTELLNRISTYQGFLQFILQSPELTLPTSYATPAPIVQSGTSATGSGSGSGVSLTSMITTLSSPVLTRIIDAQNYRSQIELNSSSNPRITSQIQYLNLQSLAQLGLSAGSPSARLLIGRLSSYSTESSPTALSLALAFSSQLVKTSESPDFKNAIAALLQEAGIPTGEIGNLASAITASSQLFQQLVALTQLGTALNNPQFVKELLLTLDATKNLAAQTSQQLNLQDVLKNSISTGYLAKRLTDQAIQDRALQQTDVAGAINRAVSQAVANANTINNQADLQTFLYAQLVQADFSSSEANKLSNLASSYAQAETVGNYRLDTPLSNNQVNAANLISSLSNANISQSVAQAAVQQALSDGRFQTNRELRDRLASELTIQGVSQNEALYSATKALIPSATLGSSQLSQEEFNAKVSRQVSGLLTPSAGADKARAAADQVISTIKSLRHQIEDNIKTVREQNNAAVDNALDDQLRAFLKPSLSLYVFSQRLLDPARTLINMGDLTHPPLPPNFQKTIDFLG